MHVTVAFPVTCALVGWRHVVANSSSRWYTTQPPPKFAAVQNKEGKCARGGYIRSYKSGERSASRELRAHPSHAVAGAAWSVHSVTPEPPNGEVSFNERPTDTILFFVLPVKFSPDFDCLDYFNSRREIIWRSIRCVYLVSCVRSFAETLFPNVIHAANFEISFPIDN